MMVLLFCDVIQNRLLLRMTHAERRVARLPRKRLFLRKLAMNPAAGVCLDLADHFGQCSLRRQQFEDMHVIRRSVDEQRCAPKLADDAAHIRKQTRPEFLVERRYAFFRAENDVDEQVGVGVSHDSIAPPGLDLFDLGTHGWRRSGPSLGAPRLPLAPPARASNGRISWRGSIAR